MNPYFRIIVSNIANLFIFPKNFTDNKTILRYVLILFLGWRISLFFITFLGLSLFPNLDFYNKKLFFPTGSLDYIGRWANWDSFAYLYIAQNGYVAGWTVFFPLYPLLIKLFTFFGLSFFWSAFLISQLCTVIFLFFLYKIVIFDFKVTVAKKTLFAILIFPASFYFGSIYSEALLLATTTMAFYYARKKSWLLASLFAALASVTKLIGIATIIGLFIEYFLVTQPKLSFKYFWQNRIGRVAVYLILIIVILNFLNSNLITSNNLLVSGVLISIKGLLIWGLLAISLLILFQAVKFLKSYIRLNKIFSANFIYLLFSLVPFVCYLLFLQSKFGSYLTFIKSESSWGKILALPWDSPVFSLNYLFSSPLTTTEFTAHIYTRFSIFTLALTCLIISCYKLRLSYIAFYTVSFLIPLFSGTLADFVRYSLVFFPMFIILGMIENELIQKFAAFLSILLLSVLCILYFNSYFFT